MDAGLERLKVLFISCVVLNNTASISIHIYVIFIYIIHCTCCIQFSHISSQDGLIPRNIYIELNLQIYFDLFVKFKLNLFKQLLLNNILTRR